MICSLFNNKGGCGKSLMTLMFANTLASIGKKVLMVDNDPQGNLTGYSEDALKVQPGVAEVYTGEQKIMDVVHETYWNNVGIIPSGKLEAYKNSKGHQQQKIGAEGMMAQLRELEKHFDFVFIDQAPSLWGIASVTVMLSDRVIIPLVPDTFNTPSLVGSLHAIRGNNSSIPIYIVRNKVKQTKEHAEYSGYIKGKYDAREFNQFVIDCKIGDYSTYNEVVGKAQNLMIQHGSSQAATSFGELVEELFGIEVIQTARKIREAIKENNFKTNILPNAFKKRNKE